MEYFFYKLTPRTGNVTEPKFWHVIHTLENMGYSVLRDGFDEESMAIETGKALKARDVGPISKYFLVSRYDGRELKFV